MVQQSPSPKKKAPTPTTRYNTRGKDDYFQDLKQEHSEPRKRRKFAAGQGLEQASGVKEEDAGVKAEVESAEEYNEKTIATHVVNE